MSYQHPNMSPVIMGPLIAGSMYAVLWALTLMCPGGGGWINFGSCTDWLNTILGIGGYFVIKRILGIVNIEFEMQDDLNLFTPLLIVSVGLLVGVILQLISWRHRRKSRNKHDIFAK